MLPTPSRKRLRIFRLAAFAAISLMLASCGGGGSGGGFFFPLPTGNGGAAPPAAQYTVGGSVSGLHGSGLVLQQSGSADVAVAVDGAFVFSDPRSQGAGYAVSVKQQPSNPTQVCSVNNGAGSIGTANVDSVRVVCAGDAYKVSVTVTGLASNDLVLQNNAGDDLAVGADGVVSFATPVANGADYGVTVKTQPTAPQVCVAKQAFGTVAGAAVGSVTVDCTEASEEKFGFTANEGAGTVTMFNVGSDGQLTTPGVSLAAGTNPQHVAVRLAGKGLSGGSVYSSNITSNSISQYRVDGGVMTPMSNPTVATGTPAFVGIEPTGRFAYVIGSGAIIRYGISTVPSAIGELVNGTAFPGATGTRRLNFDHAGRFLFTPSGGNAIQVFRLDPLTGDPISPPVSVAVSSPNDIAIDPTDRFAYVVSGSGTLSAYAIDQTTGALTPINSGPTGNTPFSVAVDPTGRFVYASNRNTNDVSAYAIDPRTGALTPVPGQPFSVGGSVPDSVVVDRTGRFVYTANQAGGGTVSVFTIDRATGALTRKAVQSSPGGPQFLSLMK